MPAPGAVTFTPFADKYGLFSLKDISVEGWSDSQFPSPKAAENPFTPLVPPIRTPMFWETAQDGLVSKEGSADTLKAPGFLEKGARRIYQLTRTWIIFFEKLTAIVNKLASAVTGTNSARKLHCVAGWVDEIETGDIWAQLGAADATTDPILVTPTLSAPRTGTPPYARPWAVGDFLVWNDPDPSGHDPYRKYEVARITAISDAGQWTVTRHWEPATADRAIAHFASWKEAHAGVRVYRVNVSHFCYDVKREDFLMDRNGDTGIPHRWDMVLPSACVVGCYVAAEDEFGMGPWTPANTSYRFAASDVKLVQPAPGLRTCVGAAYFFEEPGDIVARDRPDGAGGTISTLNFYPNMPIRIQDWASIRTMYGFVGTPAVNPGSAHPLRVRMKILLAASRNQALELYDPNQPWSDLEDLDWQNGEVASPDEGRIVDHQGAIFDWNLAEENPPTERRMPYCEYDACYWDPEAGGHPKVWPTKVLEADAWVTFDVLNADVGDDGPPSDIQVVIQT